MRLLPLLFVALATPVFGQLKWDNPEQSFAPKPLDRQVVAKFRFTNIGTMPVTINEVRTSCGCTTAALEKKLYHPGESGEIDATFTIAGLTGHQEKSIFVTTSAALVEPVVLRLKVDIPEAIKIEPQLVLWRLGERPDSKTIRIAVPEGMSAKIVSVVADNAAVKLELHEIRPGKEWEVKVTPPSTKEPAGATLLIRTNYPPANPETHYAYARVK
ncbi:MAG: DUF1573 domain-containing protein [Chthoniobacterales bacterium]